MGYGAGGYGEYTYGVPPVYPARATPMPRALRIRGLLYLILVPTFMLLV